MSQLFTKLADAEAQFHILMSSRRVSDATLESAAGSGSLADGRSTPGDGTSNQGINCTCCCN